MKTYQITLYLGDELRSDSYRLWSEITALDSILLEEHVQAGCAILKTQQTEHAIFGLIPGVLAMQVREVFEEEWVDAHKEKVAQFKKGMTGNSSRVSPRPWAPSAIV